MGTNFFPTNSQAYQVALSDETKLGVFAKCVGAPPVVPNVFQHGCIIIQTDSGLGNKAIYENVGDSVTPSWDLIGSSSATEIALSDGRILVGGPSNFAQPLVMSGDATLSNAGALTLGNNVVTSAKMHPNAKTHLMAVQFPIPLPAPTGADQTITAMLLPFPVFVMGINVISSVSTVGSDANNHYSFELFGSVSGNRFSHPTNPIINTSTLELTAGQYWELGFGMVGLAPVVGYPLPYGNFGVPDRIMAEIKIKDDGGAGPTDLSSARITFLIKYFTI